VAPGDVRSAFGGCQRERAYHDAMGVRVNARAAVVEREATVAVACLCPPASRDLIVSTARTEILVKMARCR
jgi:hypothetical protein